VALAVAEALAVALTLHLLKQVPPDWLQALLGRGHEPSRLERPFQVMPPTTALWFGVLPVLTLEAYAWGMLGSSLTRRVLTGAALAAVIAAPVWLIALFTPPPVFLGMRLVAAVIALILSITIFVTQSRDAPLGPSPKPAERPDPRKRWADAW